jgi:hypothetical protein
MRYSIIHHDVREKFDLTVAECIVADSISKLCRLGTNGTTHKSNVEIGKFIGFNEITVRRAKEALIKKGLVFEMLNGVGTTPLWEENATFYDKYPRQNVDRKRQNVEQNRQNVEHSIYNKDNQYSASAESEVEDIVEVPINDDDSPRRPREKADTSYRKVFAAFRDKYPANWNLNRTQIQAAKNLLAERGMNNIRGALKFHRENSEHRFCPSITSPYDLDSKWSKLAEFRKKYG